jgi:hypothetical protein
MDIRVPLGSLFAIYGVLLLVYGLIGGEVAPHHRLAGISATIVSGIGMLIFGLVMLTLSRRGGPTTRRAMTTPEGRATEEREKRRGLEH